MNTVLSMKYYYCSTLLYDIDEVISFAANISLVELSLQQCLSQAACSDHDDSSCVSSDRMDTTKAYPRAINSMRLLQ